MQTLLFNELGKYTRTPASVLVQAVSITLHSSVFTRFRQSHFTRSQHQLHCITSQCPGCVRVPWIVSIVPMDWLFPLFMAIVGCCSILRGLCIFQVWREKSFELQQCSVTLQCKIMKIVRLYPVHAAGDRNKLSTFQWSRSSNNLHSTSKGRQLWTIGYSGV